MNAVLYTHQLEPITVVDLPLSLWARLWRGEAITIALPCPPCLPAPEEDLSQCSYALRQVEITGEPLRRRGCEALMLFTSDEESALLLRADFLPSQRSELHDRHRRAFVSGFLEALQG